MPVPIEMPKPGVTVEECLLAKWLKQPGDAVSAGDVLAEIETDKANFEIAAPADGVLLDRFFSEGELVPVYTVLCVIGEPGESAEPFRPAAARQAPDAPPIRQLPDLPEHAPQASSAGQGLAPLSPRARRYAAEHGMPPQPVAGSGPGGRVIEADLKAARRVSSLARAHIEGSGPAGMILARDVPAPPPKRAGGIRERIAQRMRESLGTTAQYTLHSSAAAAGLLALRAKVKASGGRAPDVNINEMVMFCAVKALLRMPELNAEFIDGKLRRHEHVHIGFAADTPRGLLVPVVRNSETLSLPELAVKLKSLAAQAAEGAISPDDLAGATFTVSNLGSLGIESFTPILNPPQVAILGVDAIELRPVRRDGQVDFVDRIGLSLTCDHQVIDGAPGARFLLVVRECIENIEELSECTTWL